MDRYLASRTLQTITYLVLLCACTCTYLLCFSKVAHAETMRYQVEIEAKSEIKSLLEPHLDLTKWRENARMSPAEWARLTKASPQQIRALMATEGYFNPVITTSNEQRNDAYVARLEVQTGPPTFITQVDIKLTGAITETHDDNLPNAEKIKALWPLEVGMPFKQESWSSAKRLLLRQLLVYAFPNASITNSQVSIDPASNTATLKVEIDSGNVIYFGDLNIKGLSRYPESIVRNLSPINTGRVYQQDLLLLFQTRLLDSSYFNSVEVTANTKLGTTDDDANQVPVDVVVDEHPAIRVGTGIGFSTNTGARTQLSVDHLNLFDRSLRVSSSLRLEQRLQALTGSIRFPTTAKGYRDSINATANHTDIEGQRVSTTAVGVRRAWGTRQREQYIGANFINEHISFDGAKSLDIYAATLNYGIILRRIDHELNPTRGYLLNAQFASAPLNQLASGSFLQTYLKMQTYYPLTTRTQFIARAELGMVSGVNNVPAAYLFRTGGDQTVRGYGFQSLGVPEGDAIMGGRYLATASLEMIQWLSGDWGAAIFLDAGNAANTWQTLKPAYGYGLGARWKSPVGPIGADIAYGQETNEYRLHFNIGVVF